MGEFDAGDFINPIGMVAKPVIKPLGAVANRAIGQLAPVKGPGAFADEAATIMENAARSRGLNPSSGIVNMAITRKQALKRIEGLIGDGSYAGIESHIAKLTRPGSGPHVRNELSTRLTEVERLASHVGDKSGADILVKIGEWRKRISEIADVDY